MADQDYRARIYERYGETLAPELRAGTVSSEERERGFASLYAPHLPADKSARILDLGCGEGAFLAYLQKSGYAAAEGVDGSEGQVARAKKAGVKNVAQGDFSAFLAARPGAYDCVVAFDVFEHLRKDELLALTDAVFASLKPGGRLIVQTINADGLGWGRQLAADLTHETAFTRYSLSQLFTICGFSSSEFHPLRPASLRRRLAWSAVSFFMSLLHHAETGSGLRRNDHILTSLLLGVAHKGR